MIRRFGVASAARVVTADMEYKGVQSKENDQIQVPSFMYGATKPRCGAGSVNGMLYLPLAWDPATTIEPLGQE